MHVCDRRKNAPRNRLKEPGWGRGRLGLLFIYYACTPIHSCLINQSINLSLYIYIYIWIASLACLLAGGLPPGQRIYLNIRICLACLRGVWVPDGTLARRPIPKVRVCQAVRPGLRISLSPLSLSLSLSPSLPPSLSLSLSLSKHPGSNRLY